MPLVRRVEGLKGMADFDLPIDHVHLCSSQVLVTKPDFYNPESRHWLRQTLLELLTLNILPIINTNDAVSSPTSIFEDSRDR